MREPVTKVFRRAGCGKSARPVRRGDGAPRISPLLTVLLYRPEFFFQQRRTAAIEYITAIPTKGTWLRNRQAVTVVL